MIVSRWHSVTVKKFEDLFVWQQARELVRLIYSITNDWKDFGLKDQIRRAAVSVMSNIAEGFERGSRDEFLYFLYVARGSCGEVRAQLYVALDQKFLSRGQFDQVWDKADHTSRLIAKLISGYKKSNYGGQRLADPDFEDKRRFEEHLKRVVEEARKKREQ